MSKSKSKVLLLPLVVLLTGLSTYRIMLLSSEGIRSEGDIIIPANAPNPATTSTGFGFVPLPTEEEYTILVIIGDDLITKTFVAPSCPDN